jgi:putative PIN family toxin of toxin-antitoxin system
MPLSVVLDTNVVISGFLWKGAPRTIMGMIETEDIKAFSSVQLFEELREVLEYKKIKKRLVEIGYTIEESLTQYEAFTIPVFPSESKYPIVTDDPDDDIVVLTALAAGADFIITGNRHLLDLGSYRNINIVSPSQFLRIFNKSKIS